jgi:nucleoside-diphosphate-sugar epimerase
MTSRGGDQVKLLVTGAGGFVGAAVVRRALAVGHDVVATGRSATPTRLVGTAASYHAVDLSDYAAVDAMVDVERPDIIIHSAWEGVSGAARASDIQMLNVHHANHLVDAAIRNGACKFVGIGSQAEYGRYDRLIREDDLPNPSMIYGVAKLAAYHFGRQRAADAGLNFAWLRLFSPYGPGDNGNWLIPSLIAQMAAGVAPKMTAGAQKWDYLFIDDCADAILAASVSDATGVFNLCSGEATRVHDIAEAIRDQVAPRLDLTFGEIPYGPAQIMHLQGDRSHLSAATGWVPKVSFKDGLIRTIDAMVAA